MVRSKKEIMKDLMAWSQVSERPDEIFADTYFDSLELVQKNAVLSRKSHQLSRANFNENWDIFNYMTESGMVYYLPKVLYLLVEDSMDLLFDMTNYQNAIFEPEQSKMKVLHHLSEYERKLVDDVIEWGMRYRWGD